MCEYNFLQYRPSVIAVAAILNAMWVHNLNDVDFQAIVVGLDLLAADEGIALKRCRLELVESFFRTFPEMAPGHWSAGSGGRHSPTSVLDVHLAAAQRQMYTMGSKGVAANANTGVPVGLRIDAEAAPAITMEDELEIAACGSPIPMTNGKIGYGGSGAAGGGSTSAAGAGRKSPVGICDQLDPTVEYFRPRASSCDGIIDMTN
jgi:hypothetical protein